MKKTLKKKKIIAYADNSGAKFWRIITPFKYMTKYDCVLSSGSINEKEVEEADVIVLHNVVDKEGIATVLAAREISGYKKKIIMDVDDALFVQDDNPYKRDWDRLDASFVLEQTAKEVDVITTTNEYLASKLKKLNKNVRIVPNYFDPDWFKVKTYPNTTNTIRIGWGGSITHYDDFSYVAPVINKIMRIDKRIKFILCGDPRLKDLLEVKERVEMVPSVPIEAWPQRLAAMVLDIGIAPLLDTDFNRCKSPIKWIEYSMLSIPSVCSSTVYSGYSQFIATTQEEWEQQLWHLIENKAMREEYGKEAKKAAESYDIRNHLEEWEAIYV